MDGDRFAAADFAKAIVGLAFDAHTVRRQANRRSHIRPHRCEMRQELRALSDDRHVDVADFQTLLAHNRGRAPEQIETRRIRPSRISV